ncbi:hypothetical protein N9U60_03275 [Betaproteobacteria bacterium]|nr:hypothetical protein [Betaproteobacteria bacterium]
MRITIIALLTLIPIYGFPLNWKKVAENDMGKYYIDFDSIENKNKLVYYTDLVDFIEPFKGDYSAINRYAVDCKSENQKWLSFTTFSKSMGKGDTNNQSNPNEIIFPQPNTIYFFIIKNVCNYRKQ